jgi:hypothetical protein
LILLKLIHLEEIAVGAAAVETLMVPLDVLMGYWNNSRVTNSMT